LPCIAKHVLYSCCSYSCDKMKYIVSFHRIPRSTVIFMEVRIGISNCSVQLDCVSTHSGLLPPLAVVMHRRLTTTMRSTVVHVRGFQNTSTSNLTHAAACHQLTTMHIYTASKKLCKFVFVSTLSNFLQF